MAGPTPHLKFNYSKITDLIYLGSNFCCQAHFDRNLLSLGVTADISLEEERLDSPWGVNYFLWLPTTDHQSPSFHALMLGSQAIDYFVKNKIKVYIHCKNGHGRAPTLLAAYFVTQGKSVDEAVRLIKTRRQEVHLEDTQKRSLEEFAKSIE